MYDELAKKVNAIHAIDTIKLVIKIGYIINVKDIDEKKKNPDQDKYITTSEFNQFSETIFDHRLKLRNLVSKSDIANFITKTCFDEKLRNINKEVTSNKTKHLKAGTNLTNLPKKRFANVRKRI